MDWRVWLSFTNLVFSGTILILAFSLFLYLLLRTVRTDLSRSLALLFLCVTIVYGGDLMVNQVTEHDAILRWLRFQWLGIAFVPAAYSHFAVAVLDTTTPPNWRRKAFVAFNYLAAVFLWIAAWFTDWIVTDGKVEPPVSQLSAGPYFWIFVVYFAASLLAGAVMIFRARSRYSSATVRRRLVRLALSFAAPGVSVFPYLAVTGSRQYLGPDTVLFLSLVGNVGIGFMLVVMAYTVSYYGIFTPDRVIKHDLLDFLARAPLLASVLIGVVLASPTVSRWAKLPLGVTTALGVAIAVIVVEGLLQWMRPVINWIAYRKDWRELAWLEELNEHLLTSTDLQQIMEGALWGLCEVLSSPSGLVAVLTDKGLKQEASCGYLSPDVKRFLEEGEFPLTAVNNGPVEVLEGEHIFVPYDGYWLVPLRTRARDEVLGVIALRTPEHVDSLDKAAIAMAGDLIRQVERALEDGVLQQGIFLALQRIIPDIERVQRWRGRIMYRPKGVPLSSQEGAGEDIGASPEFVQWVKDALSHYWGGPKLRESPLLELKVVSETAKHEGSPIRALRKVLREAVERLRPEGERQMTSPEWTLYNIVDLKFIQGKRTREVANRLAMSESDLYRKQRMAIAEVARALADLNAWGKEKEKENRG